MRVLGIDPGIKNLGWGIVEGEKRKIHHLDSGVFSPTRSDDLGEKLLAIFDFLCEKIEQYQPDLVAIESVFVSKNPRNTLRLGEVRAAAILACTQKKTKFKDYAPREVKKNLTGSGAANKNLVADMVCTILKMKRQKSKLDRYDAIALAISGIWDMQWKVNTKKHKK
ncbi:MAG: crossover junction endodeoxyribonuclease RuvC [Candidatus Zixiibacteriota bacterium]